MEMTKSALRELCTQHKLYRTPHLNDKLYLHFKGFTHIANLEEYINLKALFLDSNALQSLDGLPRLEQLKCMYVQQNCLRSLRGLQQLPILDTLNVSSNGLDSLENLQDCPLLSTLTADHNHLSTWQALVPLLHCTNLHTLDLQQNDIEDPAVMDAIITHLPQLRCLYLKGNPVVSNIKSYRKVVISRCPNLTYLDDRPVQDEERRCCEACTACCDLLTHAHWEPAVGGIEAERTERAQIKEEVATKERRNFEWMQQLRREGFRKRRAMLGLPEGDTDPFMDILPQDGADRDQQGSDSNSGSECEFAQELPELLAARQQLAAFTARPHEEEPAEVASARQQLAQQGETIQEGSWSGADAPAGGISDDGMVYMESVRAAQRELDAGGSAAPAAAAIRTAGGSLRSGPVAAGTAERRNRPLLSYRAEFDLLNGEQKGLAHHYTGVERACGCISGHSCISLLPSSSCRRWRVLLCLCATLLAEYTAYIAKIAVWAEVPGVYSLYTNSKKGKTASGISSKRSKKAGTIRIKAK
ncbi:hypothetical protein COO60DRAFT_1627121 [Scenedesmus sp. NREL 46B-D3]|nr:hypothetical protein COO60DRAFT_1627121 [Scenedesmus sp. NREL 46B-D3]